MDTPSLLSTDPPSSPVSLGSDVTENTSSRGAPANLRPRSKYCTFRTLSLPSSYANPGLCQRLHLETIQWFIENPENPGGVFIYRVIATSEKSLYFTSWDSLVKDMEGFQMDKTVFNKNKTPMKVYTTNTFIKEQLEVNRLDPKKAWKFPTSTSFLDSVMGEEGAELSQENPEGLSTSPPEFKDALELMKSPYDKGLNLVPLASKLGWDKWYSPSNEPMVKELGILELHRKIISVESRVPKSKLEPLARLKEEAYKLPSIVVDQVTLVVPVLLARVLGEDGLKHLKVMNSRTDIFWHNMRRLGDYYVKVQEAAEVPPESMDLEFRKNMPSTVVPNSAIQYRKDREEWMIRTFRAKHGESEWVDLFSKMLESAPKILFQDSLKVSETRYLAQVPSMPEGETDLKIFLKM